MSETAAQQEPSMAEILASIRKVISEDGTEPADGETPDEEAAADDDVFELTDVVEEGTAQAPPEPEPIAGPADDGRPDVTDDFPAAPAETAPEPEPEPIDDGEEALISAAAGAASAAALSRLLDGGNLAGAKLPRGAALGSGALTLEELVRGMLRPLLRDWLDENLPAIVEKAVRREVERLGQAALRR